MSYSIYESFLTLEDCIYYCKQVAARLNLTTYEYFYDNRIKKKFNAIKKDEDGNVKLRIDNTAKFLNEFAVFKDYELYRIKFNLTKPKTIMKMGLDAYVAEKKELKFNITIKGYSFLYAVEFHESKPLYIIEDSGQMCMLLN